MHSFSLFHSQGCETNQFLIRLPVLFWKKCVIWDLGGRRAAEKGNLLLRPLFLLFYFLDRVKWWNDFTHCGTNLPLLILFSFVVFWGASLSASWKCSVMVVIIAWPSPSCLFEKVGRSMLVGWWLWLSCGQPHVAFSSPLMFTFSTFPSRKSILRPPFSPFLLRNCTLKHCRCFQFCTYSIGFFFFLPVWLSSSLSLTLLWDYCPSLRLLFQPPSQILTADLRPASLIHSSSWKGTFVLWSHIIDITEHMLYKHILI